MSGRPAATRASPAPRALLALGVVLGLLAGPGGAAGQEGRGDGAKRSGPAVSVRLPRLAPEVLDFTPSGPVEVDAEAMEVAEGGRVVRARGGVVVRLGGRTLRCDRLEVDLDLRTGRVEGRGELQTPEGRLTFESAEIDVGAATAVVVKVAAEDVARSFSMRAERLSRLSDGRIFLYDAWLSPCECPAGEPSWAIAARTVRVSKEGRASWRRGWWMVKGRRVLPMPFGSVSLTDGRSSGLLLPEVRVGGTNPFQIGLPFFVVTSRHTDLTVTPTWVDTRGLKAGLEFRWMAGPEQGGSFRFDWIHDQHLRDELRERWPGKVINDLGQHGYDDDRFYLSFRSLLTPGPYTFGAEVELTRDDLWFRDFRQDLEGRSLQYLPSYLWGTARRGPWVGGVTATLVRDLGEVRNAYGLQRIPGLFADAVRLRAPVTGLERFTLDLSMRADHFAAVPDLWDPGSAYDTGWDDVGQDGVGPGRTGYPGGPDGNGSEGNHRYEQGEPVHRLDRVEGQAVLRTEVEAGGIFTFTPRVGVRGVLYDGYRPSEDLGYLVHPSLGFDLRTALFRDFAGKKGRVRHVIEPWVELDATPATLQEPHPLVFRSDRAVVHHTLAAGVTQRWLVDRAGSVPGRASTARAVELRLWEDVEMTRTARMDGDRPFGPLRVEALYDGARTRAALRGAFDLYGDTLPYLAVEAGTKGTDGNAVRVGFDWLRGQEAGEGAVHVGGDPTPTLRSLPTERNEVAQLWASATWAPQTWFGPYVPDPKGILSGIHLGLRWRVDLADLWDQGRRRFVQQVYTFEYRSPCRCWSLGADVTVDPDLEQPSVALRLDLTPRPARPLPQARAPAP
ncbi:hypothetical protein L6R50_08200 [Myxococcota bacterium]|nr:hypothetical protein [Myxococcota bacterium]